VNLKGILGNLMEISDEWAFDNGLIASLHKDRIALGFVESPKWDIDKPTLNKMIEFKNVLKSKTIIKASLSPQSGQYIVKHPYEIKDKIPIIDNSDKLKMTLKFLSFAYDLENANSTYKDPEGNTSNVVRFMIDNVEFADILNQIGESEAIDIVTGDKLTFVNMKTQKIMRYPKVVSKEKVEIQLGMDATMFLSRSLIGEKSEVTIAENVAMLVKNTHKTFIGARVRVTS
jgi:hypothetical protein